MKKILTAVDNPTLNIRLKEEKDIKIIGKDIPYKEGILEFLEKYRYNNNKWKITRRNRNRKFNTKSKQNK